MTGDRYVPAQISEDCGTSDDRAEWHLYQDLVLALGPKREGDKRT